MRVTLDWHEVRRGAEEGVLRNVHAMADNRKRRFDAGSSWDAHILGACGEMAYAKCMGVYWTADINTFKGKSDVAGVEVRTRSNHDWDLIIRKDDPAGRPYVLVTGEAPDFQIHGWIMCEDGRQEQWLKNHGGYEPAYFVPKSALRPISVLKIILGSMAN